MSDPDPRSNHQSLLFLGCEAELEIKIGAEYAFGCRLPDVPLAAELVTDPTRRAWLQKNRFVNLYEDQLVSYLLVGVAGFDITDYSGYTFRTGSIPDAGNLCAARSVEDGADNPNGSVLLPDESVGAHVVEFSNPDLVEQMSKMSKRARDTGVCCGGVQTRPHMGGLRAIGLIPMVEP